MVASLPTAGPVSEPFVGFRVSYAHGDMPLTLEDLGWTPRFAEAFEPYRAEGVSPARVCLEHTHIYRVIQPDGEIDKIVSCRKLPANSIPVCHVDWRKLTRLEPLCQNRLR